MQDRWGNNAEVGDIVLYAPSTKGTIEYGKILQVDEIKKRIKVHKFIVAERNSRKPDKRWNEREWAIFYASDTSSWVLAKSIEGVMEWQRSSTSP